MELLVRRARSVANGGEAGLIARSHGAGATGANAYEWTAVRMSTALVGEARLRAALVDGILERRHGARGRHGAEQEAPNVGAVASMGSGRAEHVFVKVRWPSDGNRCSYGPLKTDAR
jgi:hypothetical protein